MRYVTVRLTYFYAGIACIILLIASYYFQYAALLEPCPLCLIQRFIMMVMALFFLLAALVRQKLLMRILTILLFLLSIGGIVSAARKVMFEHSASSSTISTCIPDLGYMLHNLPLQETLSLLFQGSGSCAEIDWQFLGLSMSGWTLSFFAIFALLAGFNFFRMGIPSIDKNRLF